MKACRARRRAVARPRTKPWDMWSRWRTGADVARMEDVLDLYARPDPKRAPLVCFDETPMQSIGETRMPIPAAPGQPDTIASASATARSMCSCSSTPMNPGVT